ncbi:hypothetical protein [Algibacter mikhailovii]|uniref:Uncharacterized protein n=1 Tax=Algibacter mikhailovii TaxID=425498 RepID=A0A918RBA9_9FLAO|nr:hypothetical protein [Algibacter mikhailovii]GGZ92167.1 hypothetical protein GCM10007028_33300 [Algibacter mikhailovii]
MELKSKGLVKTFEELRNNLFKSFVFYIPKTLIPEEKKEEWSVPKYAIFFDTIFYIDSKGFDKLLGKELCYGNILNKKALLKTNIFQFIDIKQSLNEQEFSFFMEIYLEQLNFCIYIGQWMSQHITEHIQEYTEDNQRSFELQANLFQLHLQDIQTRLIEPRKKQEVKPVDVLNYIENKLPALHDLIPNQVSIQKSENAEQQSEQILQQQKQSKRQTRKIRKKRPLPIINDTEIENYLLRTVFNIS